MRRDEASIEDIYQKLANNGIDYKGNFRAIKELYRGEKQALASVRLSGSSMHTLNDYMLHPVIMEAVLQLSLLLSENMFSGSKVPIHERLKIESVQVLSASSSDMYIWIQKKSGRAQNEIANNFNVEIYDSSGKLCVRMTSVTLILKAAAQEAGDALASLAAKPVWQTVPLDLATATTQTYEAGAGIQRHLLVCDVSELDIDEWQTSFPDVSCKILSITSEDIAHKYSQLAIGCFEYVQNIFSSKSKANHLIQLISKNAGEQGLLGGLLAVLKTAHMENPNIQGQFLLFDDLGSLQSLSKLLAENSRRPLDSLVKYEGGVRQVLTWERENNLQSGLEIPFKEQGVYLITGGMGGLGQLFATEILRQTKNSNVILTGRSPINSSISKKLAGLTGSLARVKYVQLDLSDIVQVRGLVASILSEHHKLDGVLHCAGMIQDNFIAKKTAEEFNRVLEPKVMGTVHLDLATADIDLDFFVMFSSIAAVAGNLGQIDYATANSFMDHYSQYRNCLVANKQRFGVTKSINWPLWSSGGMKIDALAEEMVNQATGMVPMSTATGLKCFYHCLSSNVHQFLYMSGNPQQINKFFGETLVSAGAEARPQEEQTGMLPHSEVSSTSLNSTSFKTKQHVKQRERLKELMMADIAGELLHIEEFLSETSLSKLGELTI